MTAVARPAARPFVVAIEDERLRARVELALQSRGIAPRRFEGLPSLWSTPLGELPAAAILDGPSATAIARQLADFFPSLPILVLTGYARPSRARSLAKLGNVRVRQKPLDADQMLRALEHPKESGAQGPACVRALD